MYAYIHAYMHIYIYFVWIGAEGRELCPCSTRCTYIHMLTYTSVHIHLCTGKEGREPVPMLNPLSPKPYLPTPRPTVQVLLLSAFLLHCMILLVASAY